ncbi:MAG: glutathione S-transferase [Alphaproteobacteria bacterium]|jgi:glutathione S-transferase|nr:glutathione S-transferase [Alphaproteobacteria bacterium]
MTPRLYCFAESGHSYKAALAMTLAEMEWHPVFVDFFTGEARSAEFRRDVNEMGECPVLKTDTLTLTQSGAILQWISDQTGKFGGAGDDRYEVLRWVLWDNHKLSSQLGMLRFLMHFVPEEKRPQDVIAFVQSRARSAFKTLDAHLSGRDWMVGRDVTNADLSCCSYLYYPEPFGFNRADWPNIDRWLSCIAALPGWQHPYELMTRAYPGPPKEET